MKLARFALVYALVIAPTPLYAARVEWPEIEQTARPWTRWWWHGSAVDKQNLTRCLQQYADAGLGGVEITCIYGVKGTKDRQLRYLSPEWVQAVVYAASEAKRLGMGVDLPPGAGWRMGGPDVELQDSNAALVLKESESQGGAWTIDSRPIGEKVKRPAPGGEGYTINPYSRESVEKYLHDWRAKAAKVPEGSIRGSFHDSFEYEGNWSSKFLDKFANNRGYRLEEHLQSLADRGDRDIIARVKSDFRETMSDLVRDELIVPWVEWAHENGQLARNQAHGSPGNWLDLYAACDIPETESFGSRSSNDANPLVQKFASSAAHVAGRKLVASESCTWLNQHFTETLAEIKERLDRQMLAGVNHVFYHGTAYSPEHADWPGWLFYASTQVNPQNPIWRDLPALNAYVAKCQAMLQAGEPSNDLLVYWPIYDLWHDPLGMRTDLRVHNSDRWFLTQPIGEAAKRLDELGLSFDYISDAQVQQCKVANGRIQTPGASYQAILIPNAEFIPVATLEKLNELAGKTAKVLFWKSLPNSAPGLTTDGENQSFAEEFSEAKTVAKVGDDLVELAAQAGVFPEALHRDTPLRSVRRKLDDGYCYLIKNCSDEGFDGLVSVNSLWADVVLMNAADGRIGRAQSDNNRFRVKIPARGTLFVRLFNEAAHAGPWNYVEPVGSPVAVDGTWKIEFIVGGPELPALVETEVLASWTKLAGEKGEKFAGTATYEIVLTPAHRPGEYLLSLGEVADSARVFLNGEELGVLFASPFEIPIELRQGDNKLRIEVTNVAINRIRDLDRRNVNWKIFDDINIVGIDFKNNKYVPLDTADWPIRDAGLLGPVTLTPLTHQNK